MEEGVGEKEEDEHQATAARLGMPVERLARPRLYVTRSAVLGGISVGSQPKDTSAPGNTASTTALSYNVSKPCSER